MAWITPYTDESWRRTNADRIRAMSDEELAIWMSHISVCTWCPAKNIKTANPCKGLYSGCKGNWLDWLRQEEGE